MISARRIASALWRLAAHEDCVGLGPGLELLIRLDDGNHREYVLLGDRTEESWGDRELAVRALAEALTKLDLLEDD